MMKAIGKEDIIKVDTDGINICRARLEQWLSRFHPSLNQKWIDWFVLKEPYKYRYQPANLYGIIKTHKSNYYKKPMRVITSGTNYILNNLDGFVFII